MFQPHTYSRTKALRDAFAASFEEADRVIVLDIFPHAALTAARAPRGDGRRQAPAPESLFFNPAHQTIKPLLLFRFPTLGPGLS